jgi:hypothetical protein
MPIYLEIGLVFGLILVNRFEIVDLDGRRKDRVLVARQAEPEPEG